MFNSNKSEAVRSTEICNMASFKLLMVGIFYLSFNWNAAFLCNIHLDNPEARVTNNPSDRITKESLKPVVTSKLLKFRNIFTKKSSSKLKSPYLFDVQIASISASYIKFYSLKQFSWNHCKQVGHFSHFSFWYAIFYLSFSFCFYFLVFLCRCLLFLLTPCLLHLYPCRVLFSSFSITNLWYYIKLYDTV